MANNKAHPIRAMLLANFDEWIHQPRTVLMFFFMLATTYITVYSYCNGIRTFQYEMHMGESLVYLLMSGFNGMSLASLTCFGWSSRSLCCFSTCWGIQPSV